MKIYTMEVFLISGPITKKFAKKNPLIYRTIEIRGDQSLETLHNALFKAFDREDQHLYEFQFGGEGPNDPKARRYGLMMPLEDELRENKMQGDVRHTTIDNLNLQQDEAFGYWFDFGDDWWHQIDVLSIEDKSPKGKYPKIIKRLGKSPPQYVDFDELTP